MEIHQLRYLVAVAEEGSFTAAAKRENVTQSGVSAQVAKLERELGHVLVERAPRALRLTTAGDAVLPLARVALGALDAIDEVAGQLSGLLRGHVRLGMIVGCSIPPFLDGLAAFRQSHPNIEVGLSEGGSEVLQDQVASGLLDLALVGFAGDQHPQLDAVVVTDEELVALVPSDHPLAGRSSARLRDLRAEQVLALAPGTGIRAAFDRSCAEAGVDVPVAVDASSPLTVLGLAARGAGVAVLSASMAGDGEGLVAVPLADARVRGKLGLVSRRGAASVATDALLRTLTTALTGRAESEGNSCPRDPSVPPDGRRGPWRS